MPEAPDRCSLCKVKETQLCCDPQIKCCRSALDPVYPKTHVSNDLSLLITTLFNIIQLNPVCCPCNISYCMHKFYPHSGPTKKGITQSQPNRSRSHHHTPTRVAPGPPGTKLSNHAYTSSVMHLIIYISSFYIPHSCSPEWRPEECKSQKLTAPQQPEAVV